MSDSRNIVSFRCQFCGYEKVGIAIKKFCDNACRQGNKNAKKNKKGLIGFKIVKIKDAFVYTHYVENRHYIINVTGEGGMRRVKISVIEDAKAILINDVKTLLAGKKELTKIYQIEQSKSCGQRKQQ